MHRVLADAVAPALVSLAFAMYFLVTYAPSALPLREFLSAACLVAGVGAGLVGSERASTWLRRVGAVLLVVGLAGLALLLGGAW